MKRWLLFFVITLLAGLGIGSLAGHDSGYVLMSWGNYSLETSLWFFALMLGLLVFVLYLVMRISLVMLGSDWRFNEWRRSRRTGLARKQTTRGLLCLAQGQWAKAERLLTRSAESTDMPLINYLAAARAAYEQGKHDTTDELLKAANKSTRGAELAVGISHAQLLISRGHKEQALAVLVSLRDRYPRHTYLLKLLVRLYQDLQDWVALHEMLPVLTSAGKVPQERLLELEEKVYLQLLERAVRSNQGKEPAVALKKLYHSMPRHCRYNQQILLEYGRLLHQQQQDELAEAELRHGLKSVWHDDLILLYGSLQTDGNRQWLFAEQQLTSRPNDPVLLLVLARLAIRGGDRARAREYLQTGLRMKAMPELQSELAFLLMADGHYQQACEQFRLAMPAAAAN
jgi:HemY protein